VDWEVEDYSRKIWLAGLGVYSKIDTDGSKLFDTLVKDGEKAEKLTKSAVGKKSRCGEGLRFLGQVAHQRRERSRTGQVGRAGRGFRQAPEQRDLAPRCTEPQ